MLCYGSDSWFVNEIEIFARSRASSVKEVKHWKSLDYTRMCPHQYHDFDVKEGTGDVFIREVSMCNDDTTDNRFYEEMGRFPTIEEDEPPYRLLCTEYPKAK